LKKLLLNRILTFGMITFSFCTSDPDPKAVVNSVTPENNKEVVLSSESNKLFQDFIRGVKNKDTLSYQDVDKAINLKSFMKEDLPGYIVVVPPKSNTLEDLDGIHKKVGFWLMERGKLFSGTYYDVHLVFRKQEIVLFHLFNHTRRKNEIMYYKSGEVIKLLYGARAEEKKLPPPGDSLRR
jgi:hypothetical protein